MPSRTKQQPQQRTPLSRERALRAAVELADREGIEAVSMRRLAAQLGVVPMALYKHVANKDDLLGGMVDCVIAEYSIPHEDPASGPDNWQERVRRRILAARRGLLRHPWAREVIESRRTRTPAVLGYMDSLAGTFMAGGLSADLTHHAMHALGYRIWGFSPEAFEDPGAFPIPDDPAEQEAMLREAAAAYPHIVAIALDATGGDLTATGEGCDEQFEFEFTLDLLLEAIGRLHQAGWSSHHRGAPPRGAPPRGTQPRTQPADTQHTAPGRQRSPAVGRRSDPDTS